MPIFEREDTLSSSARSLTDVEIAVLQVILQASPVDHDVLLGQLGHARFKSNWAPEGSPSFDIEVAEGPRPSRLPDGPLPVSAEIHDSQGEYTGELIVWVTAGFISALEYAWITDSMPLHLPDPASLHISADA